MSNWLEYLGAEAPPPTPPIAVIGDDPRVAAKARELAEARGSRVVTSPEGADVVLATPEAAFELGRLAQRTGGGLVKCRDVRFDADTGEVICRAEAYGGRVVLTLSPDRPAFVLLDSSPAV